jgi:hypothetical protein
VLWATINPVQEVTDKSLLGGWVRRFCYVARKAVLSVMVHAQIISIRQAFDGSITLPRNT